MNVSIVGSVITYGIGHLGGDENRKEEPEISLNLHSQYFDHVPYRGVGCAVKTLTFSFCFRRSRRGGATED